MRLRSCVRRALPIALALLAAATLPAYAQTVAGTLVAEGSGQPIEGAVIRLLAGTGDRVASTFTGPDGGFVLRAPAPGRYRLQAERIGFATALSEPLDVPADGLRYRFVIREQAVRLDAIVVESEAQCRPTGDAADMAAVWEEARKALDAVALTESGALARSAIVSYDRELDDATLNVVREGQRVRAVRSRVPIISLPAEDLERGGYVRETPRVIDWYAPDAQVLLSESFLRTHCFRLRADPARPDRIGLAFDPVHGVLPDITGVLWLDRASAELRDLEFRYVRLPWDVRHDAIGGRVAFERLGGGPWIVSSWLVRMPRLARHALRGSQVRITGFYETGADVVETTVALDRFRARPGLAPASTGPTAPVRVAGVDSVTPPPDSVYALPGITVEARAARVAALARAGFYERQEVGFGRFLTPEAIETRGARRTSDLIETLPGIRTREVRQGYGRVIWVGGTERPGGGGITLCGPRVLVDGIELWQGGTTQGPAPIDELISVHEIAGLEFYRSAAQVPAQYGGATSACGVLLVWTGPR